MKLINTMTIVMIFSATYYRYIGDTLMAILCFLGIIILRMLYREIKEL